MRNNSWTTDGRERSEEGCRERTAPLTVQNKVLHGNRQLLYDTYTYWQKSKELEMFNACRVKSLAEGMISVMASVSPLMVAGGSH